MTGVGSLDRISHEANAFRATSHDAKALLAAQCHAIDAGEFAAYGASFAVDAIFVNEAIGAVLTGRDEIVASARRHREARDLQRAAFRHYMFGTVVNAPDQDGLAEVVSTTAIVRSCSKHTVLLAALACRDLMVETSNGLVVKRRLVVPSIRHNADSQAVPTT